MAAVCVETDTGSSVVARGLGTIRVARERYTWWRGDGVDVAHEKGSKSFRFILSTYVVSEPYVYMWS